MSFPCVVLKNISFPQNKIHRDWYNSEYSPFDLVIGDSNIQHIDSFAFAGKSLNRLWNLTLVNLPLEVLHNGVFEGSDRIRIIHLVNLKLKTIENKVFLNTPALRTINIFASIVSTASIKQMFTHPNVSLMLNMLQYESNYLSDVITKDLFGNPKELSILGLANNKITVIAEDAFEIVGPKLSSLYLERNWLKTLPANIFQPIIPRLEQNQVTLYLASVHWDCVCGLQWLQQFVKKYRSMVGILKCASPAKFRDKYLPNAQMCDDVATTTINVTAAPIDTTTRIGTTIVTTIDTPIGTTLGTTISTTTVKPKFELLNCTITSNTSIQIEIKRSEKIMKIERSTKGGVNIYFKSFPEDHIVLWYKNNFAVKRTSGIFMGCIGGNEQNNIANAIKMLTVNATLIDGHTYIFCMATKNPLIMLPLNCISYQHLVI